MEIPFKERITGALILVALLVIVVPEMLSGPGGTEAKHGGAAGEEGPPVRTYNMVLDPAAAARPAAQESLVPAAESPTAPMPAPVAVPVEATPPERPAPEPAATVAAAAPRPEAPSPARPEAVAPAAAAQVASPTATAAPVAEARPAPAARGRWWTQLGSFSSRDNAERLARQLRAAGYQVDVSQIRSGSKELYRVRAGPVADRAAAVALQARLAAAGHKSSLVAP